MICTIITCKQTTSAHMVQTLPPTSSTPFLLLTRSVPVMIASPSGYEVGVNICTRRPRFNLSEDEWSLRVRGMCVVLEPTKPWVESLWLLWIRGLLCYFWFEGKMAEKKAYSWFGNYVSIAHDTQGWFLDGELGYFRLFWEAANGVVVCHVSLLRGKCCFSDVLL